MNRFSKIILIVVGLAVFIFAYYVEAASFYIWWGNVGIGKNPVSNLDIIGGNNATGVVNGTSLCIAGDCKTSWDSVASGGLAVGTTGQTVRSNGTTWLASSLLYNTGSNIGINTSNPQAVLDIYASSTSSVVYAAPVNNTYNNSSTGNTGTIQTWVVPSTGTYTIDAYGASGGQGTSYTQYAFGKGARMKGDFFLYAGEVIRILVGQQGPSGTHDGGGGGGTFIVRQMGSIPMVVAGGGGGASYSGAGADAVTTTSGTAGPQGGTGGTAGGGGTSAGHAGAGAGFTTNGGNGPSSGSSCNGGISYINGGNGGCAASTATGGFGGGGGTHGSGWGGGGGGGYSGGGASTSSQYGGGGGGSYNAGTNQTNTAGTRTGHGQVFITSPGGDVTIVSYGDAAKFTGNVSLIGGIKLGDPGAGCNSQLEGGIKYSTSTKSFLGCNGANWSGFVSGNTTPDAFSFVTQTGLNAATTTISNIVQINGIISVAASASGPGSPQIRVCTDASCSNVTTDWTTAASVLNGRYIQAKQLSSSQSLGTNAALIAVGSSVASWQVTTANTTPNPFILTAAVPQTYNNSSTGQTGTIQTWTVPTTGTYSIEAYGASGGQGTSYTQYAFGKGARMKGDFVLTAGHVIKILVGQQGPSGSNDGGGGGGTYVVNETTGTLLLAAGGGGGASYSGPGADAVTGTSGTDGVQGGAGGTGGNGGTSIGCAGAGAGYNSNGGNGPSCGSCGGGVRYAGGGNGGTCGYATTGGFGGGGGTHGGGWGGGGGGGYSGGGASTSSQYGGGGGGSYNGGTNQSNTAGNNTGHGKVIVTGSSGALYPLNTLVSSNVAQVTGLTVNSLVFLAGSGTPQYRLCSNSDCSSVSRDWGTTTAPIANNTFLQVKAYSPSASNSTTTALVSIGTSTTPFNINTGSDFVNAFTIANTTNAYLNSIVSSTPVQITGNTVPAGIVVTGSGSPTVRICTDAACNNLVGNNTYNNTSTGYTGTIQTWTVPVTGTYIIETWGAEGGKATSYTYNGGKGARMRGEFSLTAGEVIKILVGQKGGAYSNEAMGGGGTFVVKQNGNVPLIIAGGGGGSSGNNATYSTGMDASITTSSTASQNNTCAGVAGPNGGSACSNAGSGAGFSGNGQAGSVSRIAYAYTNGGNGADTGENYTGYGAGASGGFGGGGGSHGGASYGGGGGGGYAGGSAYTSYYGGGGGGSYNAGTNQSNSAGVQTGHGKVVITMPNLALSSGQYIQVLVNAAKAASTPTTATVTVGSGAPVTYTVTTGTGSATAFSFTDQTGVLKNTVISSNIIPITSTTIVGATVSGAGSPQLRICSTSDCSAVVKDWSAAADISSGQYLQVRMTSSLSDLTAIITNVYVGDKSSNWSVTTLTQISPTGLSLTHSANYKYFTINWTAGTGNGGAGSCKLQFMDQNVSGTWKDIAGTSLNCDTNVSGQTIYLPEDFTSSWTSTHQVRIYVNNIAQSGGTFPQTISCTSQGPSYYNPSPNIDENCNGKFDDQIEWYQNTYQCSDQGNICAHMWTSNSTENCGTQEGDWGGGCYSSLNCYYWYAGHSYGTFAESPSYANNCIWDEWVYYYY